MPCDQVRTSCLDMEKANVDVLQAALGKLGFSVLNKEGTLSFSREGVSGSFARGELRMRTGEYGVSLERIENEIKAGYGEESVRTSFTRFGWTEERATVRTRALEVED